MGVDRGIVGKRKGVKIFDRLSVVRRKIFICDKIIPVFVAKNKAISLLKILKFLAS